MNNKIGVMQGRLLPKYQGRYQAHPVGYWQDEFTVAKSLGLDCIEFILDFNDANNNPLIRDGGVDEITEVCARTNIEVKTICADYFMEAPLHSRDPEVARNSQDILLKLLSNAMHIGVKDIVIPCVDQSTLGDGASKNRFIESLLPVLDTACKNEINLSLETDLPPQDFLDLLNCFNTKRVTVNYDIGNSASLGYNPVDELNAYGEFISDIHIKDRVLGGGPVVLGSGDADFATFFDKLKEYDYKGPLIMQAYRDEEGVQIFKQQLEWVQRFIEKI